MRRLQTIDVRRRQQPDPKVIVVTYSVHADNADLAIWTSYLNGPVRHDSTSEPLDEGVGRVPDRIDGFAKRTRVFPPKASLRPHLCYDAIPRLAAVAPPFRSSPAA